MVLDIVSYSLALKNKKRIDDILVGSGDVNLITKSNIIDFIESDYVHTKNNETISGNKTFNNDVIINGNLEINEDINIKNCNINNNKIILNHNNETYQNYGIVIYRGTNPNMNLIFDENDNEWKVGYDNQELDILLTKNKGDIRYALKNHVHTSNEISDWDTRFTLNFDDLLSTKTTDNVKEGVNNLYLTNERVQNIMNNTLTNSDTISFEYDDINKKIKANIINSSITNKNISDTANIEWSKIDKTNAKLTDLSDVPDYSTSGSKYLAVKPDGSGIEYVSLVNDKTAVSYNDSVPDFLINKFIGVGAINITEIDDGGNEKIGLSVNIDNITIVKDENNFIKVKDNLYAPSNHSHQWSEINKSGSSIADLEMKNLSDIDINSNKDWNGKDITNIGSISVDTANINLLGQTLDANNNNIININNIISNTLNTNTANILQLGQDLDCNNKIIHNIHSISSENAEIQNASIDKLEKNLDANNNRIYNLEYISLKNGTALKSDQGGSLELGNPTLNGMKPYIDFNFGTGIEQDYNVRIQNNNDSVIGIFFSGGTGSLITNNGDLGNEENKWNKGYISYLYTNTLNFSNLNKNETVYMNNDSSFSDVISRSMLNYNAIVSMYREWYKVEKWDGTQWIDCTNENEWNNLLQPDKYVNFSTSNYEKIRFFLTKLDSNGNFDINDIYSDFSYFTECTSEETGLSINIDNVTVRIYSSTDGENWNIINEESLNMYDKKDEWWINAFIGNDTTFGKKYIMIEFDFTTKSQTENVTIKMKNLFITTQKLYNYNINNILPGISGKITNNNLSCNFNNLNIINNLTLPIHNIENPNIGSIYFDTTTNTIRIWNGEWHIISGTDTITYNLVGNRITIDGTETNVIFESQSFVYNENGFPIKIQAVIQNLDTNSVQNIECTINYDENGYVSNTTEWTVI